MRDDENENGVGKFGDHTTPFSANPINIENDGDTSMDNTNVSRASTEKAPRGISQVDYEALDSIDDRQEEIVECEVEELQYSDNVVLENDETDDASVGATPLPTNNNVVKMASFTTNTGLAEAKPTAGVTKKEASTEIIPPELRKEMDDAANRIRVLHKKSVINLVAIGRDLIAMKSRLGHGKFSKWYKSEFGWSAMAVKRYMDTARAWNDISKLEPEATIEALPLTVLYDFGKLSEAQQLQIAQAAKTGRTLKAVEFQKAKVPASSRNTDDGEAEALAKLIAGELSKSAAMNIAMKPGFDAPVFGKLLKTAITATFSGSF